MDAGDRVTVEVELDTEPREVEVPPELAEALEPEPELRAFFDGLSYTHRREYAEWVAEAKREETRTAPRGEGGGAAAGRGRHAGLSGPAESSRRPVSQPQYVTEPSSLYVATPFSTTPWMRVAPVALAKRPVPPVYRPSSSNSIRPVARSTCPVPT